MKTIWKYPIHVTDEIRLEMPMGSTVLDIQVQNNSLCLWALIDTTIPLETRRFRIFGTGNPFDLGDEWSCEFIATVQMPPFVWHIFEIF